MPALRPHDATRLPAIAPSLDTTAVVESLDLTIAPLPAPTPPLGLVLDGHPGVAAWQSELRRRNGSEELVVFLAPSRPGHPGRLVRELDEQLQTVQAPAQFVVLGRDALDRRLAEHDNKKILDHRLADR